MFKKVFKIAWKIFFVLVLLVGISFFVLRFLVVPHRVYQGDNQLFKERGLYFSEKLTYLLRAPKVGERVSFLDKQGPMELTYVGLLVGIKQEGNLANYLIVSRKDSVRPWVVTRDKIEGRIYFPPAPKEVIQTIYADKRWTLTPTPFPLKLPVAGTNQYQFQPPSNWKKYEPESRDYFLYYPQELKRETAHFSKTDVAFSLMEEEGYLEIFVKAIFPKEGQSTGAAIFEDTGLSSVPTFQKAVVADSISGWEISRNVDNFTRFLKTIYLPKDGLIYSISMRTPSPVKDNRYEEIFNHIVGTFRFNK